MQKVKIVSTGFQFLLAVKPGFSSEFRASSFPATTTGSRKESRVGWNAKRDVSEIKRFLAGKIDRFCRLKKFSFC
jgi:hypothetical protein